MKTNRNKMMGRGACIAFALIGLALVVQGCSAQRIGSLPLCRRGLPCARPELGPAGGQL
jgi:hypothetical protein